MGVSVRYMMNKHFLDCIKVDDCGATYMHNCRLNIIGIDISKTSDTLKLYYSPNCNSYHEKCIQKKEILQGACIDTGKMYSKFFIYNKKISLIDRSVKITDIKQERFCFKLLFSKTKSAKLSKDKIFNAFNGKIDNNIIDFSDIVSTIIHPSHYPLAILGGNCANNTINLTKSYICVWKNHLYDNVSNIYCPKRKQSLVIDRFLNYFAFDSFLATKILTLSNCIMEYCNLEFLGINSDSNTYKLYFTCNLKHDVSLLYDKFISVFGWDYEESIIVKKIKNKLPLAFFAIEFSDCKMNGMKLYFEVNNDTHKSLQTTHSK